VCVEIREHVAGDLDAYYGWQSEPVMATYVSWLPKTRAQSEEGLRDAIAQQDAKPRERFFFAVVDSFSKEMVGDTGFTVVEDGVGDCGWFIRRAFWRIGYATVAARLMIAVAFEEAGLHRLKASCVLGNVASERVMQKCGFTCIGRTETRARYALSRCDWRRTQK
jgi:[ribosomal protein S5]-alanine N-acetyltransferase